MKQEKIITLHSIKDNIGARKKSRPLGRGIGSGRGKTAGHGGKGQHGRSGVRLKSFEGGQTPLMRRLPKRGFVNIFRTSYAETSLERIQEAIEGGVLSSSDKIDAVAMQKAGLFKTLGDGVRVLGTGTVSQAIHVVASGVSESARKKIESAKGTVTIVPKKVKWTKSDSTNRERAK